LTDIGLSLAEDDSSFLGLFKKTDDAQEVLEYMILNQPWAPRSNVAYARLARLYEEDEEWQLAIERHEQLVLNHPGSAERIWSQAQIPHLRLMALKSPEYDRSVMLTARKELEDWLRSYAGHEFEERVQLDLADCLRRLCDNDLIIADFYATVGSEVGARFHRERALDEARAAGDEERMRAAREGLDLFPEAADAGGGEP
jgi:outer membrane protein assembly factor BamD (BamD/ComL family)